MMPAIGIGLDQVAIGLDLILSPSLARSQLKARSSICDRLLGIRTVATMVKRTTKQAIEFALSFSIKGIKEKLPAGTYSIETEEASLFGISFLPFVTRRTTLIKHPQPGTLGNPRFWKVSRQALWNAKEKDVEKSNQDRKRSDGHRAFSQSEQFSILNEPVPERLTELIKRLRELERKD